MRIPPRLRAPILAILPLLGLLLSACEHKELCFEHPHFAAVRVTFAWDGIGGYDRPEGMRVVFFPEEGGERWVFDFPGGDGGTVRLPAGGYRVVSFNYNSELIDWKNEDDHATFTADTREVYSPDRTLSRVTPDYLCGDNLDRFRPDPLTPGGETLLALRPRTMVCRYTYEVNGLRDLGQVADVRTGLSGMNGSLRMATGTASARASESMLFGGAVSGEQVRGGCYTFGYSENEGERLLFKLYVRTHSGKKYVLEDDVTEQVVRGALMWPVGDVHIVIDLDHAISDLPGIGDDEGGDNGGGDHGGGSGGSGAGFEVGADEWNDVNKDIIF